ncbi:MAG: endolytic transglycosylase MltG [Bacillota bacterium]|nr:endolytic transglycosylase MltG [Bacillota bacterium]
MRKKIILDAVLALILTIVVFFTVSITLDKKGKIGAQVSITVTQGMSLKEIAKNLKETKVIKYPNLFVLYAEKRDMDKNLKAGTHIMYQRMGYKDALNELAGMGTDENTIKLLIPEGFEIYRTAKRVSQVFDITEDQFLKEAQNGSFQNGFLKNVPSRENHLEGYLFPATYNISKGSDAHTIIQKMLDGFGSIWTPEYQARADQIGMTMDQVINLASVIEREAGNINDMGKVSSVFHNRLKIGMPLQSCATVQYILKERKSVLSIEDTKIDSPYNTYKYTGLPVGPIASPGKAAIKAALYPEDTPYYYFKTLSDGTTVFSKTRAEHDSK